MNKMDKRDSKRIGQSIKIKKYDDIFDDGGNESNLSDDKGGTIFVSPSLLRDFENHPFKVDGKGIDELMDSIRKHGILSPIIVRPSKGILGGYEVISGHRRKLCATELGLETVPIIIRDVDDDEAVLAMVDSNIQREDILPSEKAFAYKMKLEAIKRQGERTDLAATQVGEGTETDNEDKLTCGQVVHKLKSSDIIGKENNESGRQIRRYIRLTELPDTLLNAVDSKRMSFNAGVELSFLADRERKAVETAALEMKVFPSLDQVKKIREMSEKKEEITAEGIIYILMEKKNKKDEINFDRQDIRKFFPKNYTARQIEDAVIEILKDRREV